MTKYQLFSFSSLKNYILSKQDRYILKGAKNQAIPSESISANDCSSTQSFIFFSDEAPGYEAVRKRKFVGAARV